jgi:outer membrane protein TolC
MGRRHAGTRQAQDVYDMQVANYWQTVLLAFQEEDNLVTLRALMRKVLWKRQLPIPSSDRYFSARSAAKAASLLTWSSNCATE